MKFMLRLLLLIAIGTYLYDHLRPFMRQEVAKSSSAGPGELLGHVPTLVDTAFAKSSKASGNMPGYLPRRDLTPGAIDPRVTQADIGQRSASVVVSKDGKDRLHAFRCAQRGVGRTT